MFKSFSFAYVCVCVLVVSAACNCVYKSDSRQAHGNALASFECSINHTWLCSPSCNHLRRWGYVFAFVCMSVCLSVSRI